MKLIFSALFLCTVFFLSCKKYHPDTIRSKNIEKLLVEQIWQIQKITSSQSNILYHYTRGGQNNNYNYDIDYLKFNADGTGTYTAGPNSYNISWQFTNSERSELTYTINDYANGAPSPGKSMDVELENVNVSETFLKYAEIYTNENGASAVSSVHRIPLQTKY